METNLLKSLNNYITPDLVSQAANILGESESGISKAFSSAIPTLLSGLLNNANNANVMDSIMGLVNHKDLDASNVLSNLPSLLTNSGNKFTIDSGASLLNLLFGNKQSGLFDLLGMHSGVKKSSISRLMMMAAPMILGYLRKSGFSASSLIKSLLAEKDDILKAAPTGLNALLGEGTKLREEVKEKIREVNTEPTKPKNKWILPLLIAIAALLLFYLLRNCESEPSTPMVQDETPVVIDEEVIIEEPVVESTDAIFTLPNGVDLNASKTGLESKLSAWLANPDHDIETGVWYDFDRLLFATGSAELLPESQAQLRNLVEILKAYPNVSVKIGGYTDNTGDSNANLKLSGDRAMNVMKEMIAMGIDANRLSAEGYGEQHPVASNDTEEGRAQNRRIALKVTSK
ncbi:OmpA family protein [Formosa haliotis]|uniref:OmpA family protein n=1 Tax=Formosa haliotis TaxID=1555194 RepID=UPI0008246190|nr:OmpA family protein [Formosa haliotis]